MTAREGIVHGLDERDYHRGPELSSTEARRILDSPARFAWHRENPPKPSAAMNLGTLVHSKVLGVGASGVEYPAEFLTKSGYASKSAAATAWVEEQQAAGRVVVSPEDTRAANAMAEKILAHAGARELLETPGDNEVSVFATDPETGVRCRARFDRLSLGASLGVDVKTTSGPASATGFGAAAAKYGYPVQEAFYSDVLEWVTGERVPLRFIVVEKFAPFLVAVHEFDDHTRTIGRDLAAEARRTYAECAKTDTWPGYGSGVIETRMPGWWAYLNDDMELSL